MSILDDITDFLGWTNKAPKNALDEGKRESNKYLQQSLNTIDDINKLQTKGREVASASAKDKASIAKKQAMASAKMGGGSKLAKALAGASSAVSATQEGFDSAMNNAMNTQSNVNAQKAQSYTNMASNAMDVGKGKASLHDKQLDRWANVGMTGLGMLGKKSDN